MMIDEYSPSLSKALAQPTEPLVHDADVGVTERRLRDFTAYQSSIFLLYLPAKFEPVCPPPGLPHTVTTPARGQGTPRATVASTE